MTASAAVVRSAERSEFRRGFVAIVPLWLGVVPFAVAFALLARTSGLSALETVALSLLVFAGSAQLAFVELAGERAGAAVVLLTVLLLNLRYVLYGMSLNTMLPRRTHPPRPLLAAFVSDESYGFTVRAFREGRGSAGYLFGASLSLFTVFVPTTLVAALTGRALPDPERLGLDVVFPLTFLALLVPLLRHRADVLVALLAAILALGLSRVASGGVTVMVATVVAAGAGTFAARPRGVEG